MDWGNERYVRIYTRDTGDTLAIGWEGRALLWELVRKADRAGVIDDASPELLAEVTRVPFEVVERVLPRLIERGCAEVIDGALVLPNYIEAQETSRSDAARQRESRARRRDMIRLASWRAEPAKARDVTNRNADVTERDVRVTKRGNLSHPVTPYCAVLSSTEKVPCSDSGGATAAGAGELTGKGKGPPIEALKLADYLRSQILRSKRDHRIGKRRWDHRDTQRIGWAIEFDRMNRIDGRAWRRSAELIAWVLKGCPGYGGEFVVESAKALREKWDRLDSAEKKSRNGVKPAEEERRRTPEEMLPGMEILR